MAVKTWLKTLTLVTGVAAAVTAKVLWDRKKSEEDDEVRFIGIDDDEEKGAYDLTGASEEVREIAGVYPYLAPSFIESILAKNGELNGEFADDSLINIVHTVSFDNAEAFNEFETILTAGGYVVDKNGENGATACRKFYTEEGAIVSDVLNVANQTGALGGVYDKFDVFS